MPPTNHARLAPSASHRWIVCPASVEREIPFREASDAETSPEAAWGIRCHTLLCQGLTFESEPSLFLGPEEDAELGEVADFAYRHVMASSQKEKGTVLLSEEIVVPGSAVGRPDDLWGSADVCLITSSTLVVSDLKTGKGVMVEADDPQLRLYLLGLVERYGGRECKHGTLITEIIQPRGHHPAGPIRRWSTTVPELYAWVDSVLAPAVEATYREFAPARPETEACRWCKVKSTCRELSERSLSAVQAAFADAPVNVGEDISASLLRSPSQLQPHEIQYILDHEKLITGWLSAVRDHATDMLKSGQRVPGYKLAAGRKSRTWSDPDTIGSTLAGIKARDGKKIGKAMAYIEKPISPSQAESKIKPLVSPKVWERIAGMIVTSAGAPTMVPETDVRREIITDVTKMFEPIEPKADQTPVQYGPIFE